MNKTKTLMLCTALATSVGLSQLAQAESPITGNIGFTSNYIWRGATQGADESAISGGIDYAHASGFYAGTWVSSLGGDTGTNGGYEQDLYAGYGFDAGPVGLDVGYIQYMYPVGTVSADFSELYVNASWKMLNGGIALTVDTDAGGQDDDVYMYVGAEFEVAKGLTLALTYGDYDYDAAGTEDYSHFQVALSKDDFTFALDKNDKNDTGAGEDDVRFTVSYSKSIDLM